MRPLATAAALPSRELYSASLKRSDAPILIAGAIVAIARLVTLPEGFWEANEIRFAGALLTFDPSRLQPPAPVYPLYVALGRLVHIFVLDGFVALLVLSFIASVAGALLIGRLGAFLFGSGWMGGAAAIVVLLSPAMLVFGPLPNAESVAIALIAATFVALADRRGELFALLAAASIGVRPQIAPAMVAVVVIGWLRLPRRVRVAAIFAVSLATIFIPAGWEVFNLGSTFATDAVIRFIAHPWGGKLLSVPLLAAAVAGTVMALRTFRSDVLYAVIAFGLIHTATAITFGDRFDGVRPVIPALIAVGLFAVAAFARWPRLAALLSIVFATASLAYTWPLLETRRKQSPAVKAVHAAPSGSLVIADPDLAPFAPTLLTPERYDDVVRGNPLRLYLLMHGRSRATGARTFEWRNSDAYGKLTTERFRIVSLIPQPPGVRYAARSGVFAHESSPERGEWRWLARRAEIELAIESPATANDVTLRLGLPADAPIEWNAIVIGPATPVYVERGKTAEIIVKASNTITLSSQRSFIGADGRELSVQLLGIDRR